MKLGGWVFMIVCWACIAAATVLTLARTLRTKEKRQP